MTAAEGGGVTAADAERVARAALSVVLEPGDDAVARAVASFGAVTVWEAIRAGHTRDLRLPTLAKADVDGAPETGATKVPVLAACAAGAEARSVGLDPERVVERAAKSAIRLLIPGDDEWPSALSLLTAEPVALWVRGGASLSRLADGCVAIVGARAATTYGVHVAGDISAGLGEAGWAVVSGGAYGIDAAAHRGCMAAGALTAVVLACGVDVAYPRGHDRLFSAVLDSGVVVSEWPPGCAPLRHRFLVRNRVIAALGAGTVVVEAAVRSGALNTARVAAKLSLPLLVVPGPVTSAMSAGCHLLLREEPHARVVTSAAEVIEEVGRLGDDLAPLPQGPVGVRDSLGRDERRVLDALPARGGAGVASIARVAGVGLDVVRRTLPRLEVEELAERVDGGYRLGAALRRRGAAHSDTRAVGGA